MEKEQTAQVASKKEAKNVRANEAEFSWKNFAINLGVKAAEGFVYAGAGVLLGAAVASMRRQDNGNYADNVLPLKKSANG
ncbi:MAG: hypothetical protein AB7O96_15140 [Pseudobdellovibrionaceae bacterium]